MAEQSSLIVQIDFMREMQSKKVTTMVKLHSPVNFSSITSLGALIRLGGTVLVQVQYIQFYNQGTVLVMLCRPLYLYCCVNLSTVSL